MFIIGTRCYWDKQSKTVKCYTNDRIDKFNSVLKKHCDDNNLVLININERIKKEKDYSKLLIDGAHPNTKGHKIIYELILPHFKDLLNNT